MAIINSLKFSARAMVSLHQLASTFGVTLDKSLKLSFFFFSSVCSRVNLLEGLHQLRGQRKAGTDPTAMHSRTIEGGRRGETSCTVGWTSHFQSLCG